MKLKIDLNLLSLPLTVAAVCASVPVFLGLICVSEGMGHRGWFSLVPGWGLAGLLVGLAAALIINRVEGE